MTDQDTSPKSILIIDDDVPFPARLLRAMEQRGFVGSVAHSMSDGLKMIDDAPPDFAVVDLRLSDGSGLDIIKKLKEKRSDAKAIVLTGYGNIASAVSAVKLGAFDYMAKPADADEICAALLSGPRLTTPPPENPMSADRVRWEHIQRIYELCSRNVSETARRLSMHRRTLQRILAKKAPK
jgi:two-component system response regulator RegA